MRGTEDSTAQAPKATTGLMLLLVGLLLVILGMYAMFGRSADLPTDASPRGEPATAIAVQLTIRADEREEHFADLKLSAEATVFDALLAAQSQRSIGLRHELRMQQPFITAILGQEGDWLYQVNGKRPAVGAGKHELEDGDTILWEFGADQYNAEPEDFVPPEE